jgi:MFS family permease
MATTRIPSSERVTFAVLGAGMVAFALLQSLVIPVLATIQDAVHTDQNTATWLLTAYLLSASVCTPILGRVGDLLGRKPVFLAALGALAVGSYVGAVSSSIGMLIVARTIQGMGGGVLPLSFGIIRDEFPEERVAGSVGTLSALTATGAGVGIVIAGPLVDVLSYHWLFWLPGIALTVVIVAAAVLLPSRSRPSGGRISWTAAFLLTGWLVTLLLAVSNSPTWGWGSPITIGLLIASTVLIPTWIVVESRARSPLIDMNMMRRRGVWTVNVIALLLGVGMYSVFAFAPAFLQTPTHVGYGFGASVTESGLMMLPQSVASFVLGTAAAPLANTFGAKRVLVWSLLVSAASLLLMALCYGEAWQMVLWLTILGAGTGAAFSAMSSLVVNAVPIEQTGVASGMNANIRTIGGSIGSAVLSIIITAQIGLDGFPVESGYTIAFIILAVVTAAAVLPAVLVPAAVGRRVRPSVATAPHAELGVVAGGTLAGAEPE